MTYTEKELLTRLQKGENPETIAAEMTTLLNRAVEKKKKDDEEKKRLTDAKEHLKTAAAELNAYIKEVYPQAKKNHTEFTTQDLDEMVRFIADPGCVTSLDQALTAALQTFLGNEGKLFKNIFKI